MNEAVAMGFAAFVGLLGFLYGYVKGWQDAKRSASRPIVAGSQEESRPASAGKVESAKGGRA